MEGIALNPHSDRKKGVGQRVFATTGSTAESLGLWSNERERYTATAAVITTMMEPVCGGERKDDA